MDNFFLISADFPQEIGYPSSFVRDFFEIRVFQEITCQRQKAICIREKETFTLALNSQQNILERQLRTPLETPRIYEEEENINISHSL